MTNLRAKEFFVDPDIRRAESLKASAFVDPEFLELELDRVFSRSWTLVAPRGGLNLLDKPGSRAPFTLLEKPFFLQRSSTGKLSCFPNVCTHAWHPLVESPSIGGSVVCPQHGRRFDSDGKFVSHTGFENLKDFPRESDSLRKLEVENWGPLNFVCLGDPLVPFHEFVNNVQKSIPGIDPKSLGYHSVSDESREVDGNWKQHSWNYMDNYHIRFVHKGPRGLADAIELDSYKTELHNFSSLQWAYSRKPEHGFKPEQVAARFRDPKHPDKRVFALWWFIFPNMTLNFYPWGLSVNQYMPVPGRPDRTQFHWLQYSLDEEKFKQRDTVWLNKQVDEEDLEAIELVSKGARSGFAPRGRFAPREELGPHWLHRLIYTTIFPESS